MKKLAAILLLFIDVAIFCYSCSKNCECYEYDADGALTLVFSADSSELIPKAPVIKSMPKSLSRNYQLNCDFFNTFSDTTGGLKCK